MTEITDPDGMTAEQSLRQHGLIEVADFLIDRQQKGQCS
jgi:hypothetical protein